MDEINSKVFYDMVIRVRGHRDLSEKIEINRIFM
ncbi:hypothetical protein J2S24_001928 [Thermoanaerobacter pentosaceus]|jgi:hypothetical protein|uniref:Uncharacterized protein n=1 Tax=Thermoanaerobacter pentosaceus TaxID=694059 RepID=A0ABT9M5R7_9THEO|nr:hypothetical protein [Thermoanaerobacter pentosaceus]